MKFRFEFVYRFGLVLLLIIAFWSVWANAQPASSTNSPASSSGSLSLTNQFQAMTFGLDNVEFLNKHKAMGQPLWKYAASLIYIVLAFCVAWFLDFVVSAWLRRFSAKSKTPHDQLLLKLLRGPVKVVAFVILLNIGLGVFDWPARAQLVLSRGLIVIVAISVTYLAVNVVEC